MNTEKKKKHRHAWEFHRWIRPPESPESSPWNLTVERACPCGKHQKDDPTDFEVQAYITDHTCTRCGEFGHNHTSDNGCITALRTKVIGLEGRLESLEDKLNLVRDAFGGLVNRGDRW